MQKDRGDKKKNPLENTTLWKKFAKTDLTIYKYKHFVKDSQFYNILSSNIN